MEKGFAISAHSLVLLAILVAMGSPAAAQYDDPYPDTAFGDETGGRVDPYGDDLPDPDATGDLGEAPREEKDPMNWIGVGLKAGFLYFGDATFNYVTYVNGRPAVVNKGVPARGGFVLSLPINLGSSGFGWVFDPYLGLGAVGSYGIYTGPTITLHLSDMTYLGFGLGARAGIITQDFWGTRTDVGMDIYGRIPVVLTYYAADSLGLVLEVGLGLGATGYRPVATQQQLAPGEIPPPLETKFGVTFQIDASAGVRFP